MKLVDMYHDLTSNVQGMAPITSCPPPGIESFKLMADDHGALAFAKLEEVYSYLRGNKHLSIPSEWYPFVPKIWNP